MIKNTQSLVDAWTKVRKELDSQLDFPMHERRVLFDMLAEGGAFDFEQHRSIAPWYTNERTRELSDRLSENPSFFNGIRPNDNSLSVSGALTLVGETLEKDDPEEALREMFKLAPV